MKISKSKVIISSVIIAVCIIAVITVNFIKEKRKEELEQRMANDQMAIESFMTGKSATFEEFLAECKINMDDINAVTIGTDSNESGMIYIDNPEVVKSICEKFEGMVFEGVDGNSIMDKYEKDKGWTISFYSNKEYSFGIGGYSTIEDDVESVMLSVGFDGDDSGGYYTLDGEDMIEWNPAKITGSYLRHIIIDENIGKFLSSIYEENVSNITEECILEMHTDGEVTLEEIFKYGHSQNGNGSVENYKYMEGYIDTLYTNIYIFPIEGSEAYLELEKGNITVDSSEIYINGEKVLEPIICNDIVRVEIVNESGDRIDFYQATKEEIEEFIN